MPSFGTPLPPDPQAPRTYTRESWAAAHPEGSWEEIIALREEIIAGCAQRMGLKVVPLATLEVLFSEPKPDMWPPPNWALYGPQNWREYKQPVSGGRLSGFDERRFWLYCDEYDRRPEVAAAQRKARERAGAADERARRILAGHPPDEIYPNKPAQPEGVPDIIIRAFQQDFLADGVAALESQTSSDRYRRMSKPQREAMRKWLMNGASHG